MQSAGLSRRCKPQPKQANSLRGVGLFFSCWLYMRGPVYLVPLALGSDGPRERCDPSMGVSCTAWAGAIRPRLRCRSLECHERSSLAANTSFSKAGEVFAEPTMKLAACDTGCDRQQRRLDRQLAADSWQITLQSRSVDAMAAPPETIIKASRSPSETAQRLPAHAQQDDRTLHGSVAAKSSGTTPRTSLMGSSLLRRWPK